MKNTKTCSMFEQRDVKDKFVPYIPSIIVSLLYLFGLNKEQILKDLLKGTAI